MTAFSNFTAWFFGSTFLWSYLLMALLSMMAVRQSDAVHLRFARSDPAPARRNLFFTLLWGAAAGVAGSALWRLTGLTLTEQEGMVLWMSCLGWMLLGLSEYGFLLSGVIVTLLGLGGGNFSGGSAPLLLMAVCQFLFGILVMADGRRDNAAVVLRDGESGIVGGRMLSRIWIIPMLAILPSDSGNVLLPLALPMGIGLIAHRRSPRELTLRRGAYAAASGVLIFAVGYAIRSLPGQLPVLYGLSAAVCAGEWIYDRRADSHAGSPWCGWPEKGLRVLDVRQDGVGRKLGLRPGDVLLRLNGGVVMQEPKIEDTLEQSPSMVWVDYERNGKTLSGEYADYAHGIRDLGIVPLARNMDLFLETAHTAGLWFSRRL